MYKKVLLLSPEPYYDNSSSRYLASFWGGWPPECIAQFYTTASIPNKGFCENYFRITDEDILRKTLFIDNIAGQIIDCMNIETANNESTHHLSQKTSIVWKVKALFKRKTPIYHLARMLMWGNRWESEKFYHWVKEFGPDLIYLDLGQENILANIALKLADKFSIPLITFIGDDFYYKSESGNKGVFKYLYRDSLQKTTKDVLERAYYNIFCCDLMRDVYCKDFDCKGDTLYFTSNMETNTHNREKNTFAFLGSFEYGRWKSLISIGNALQSISENLYLDVYGNADRMILAKFLECKGIRFHGRVPYESVINVMAKVAFVVHVEDFADENKVSTRYSLSTKIADCLTCGACTFAYGPKDVGSIDYLLKNHAAQTCTDPVKLRDSLKQIIDDEKLRERIVFNGIQVAKQNHSVAMNQLRIKEIVDAATSQVKIES